MKLTTVALLLVTTVQTAFAWNSTGHKAVAFIAYSHLTPKAQATVDALIRRHPMFDQFVQDADPTSDHLARIAFVNFATWPDFIRSDDDFVDTPRMTAACKPQGAATSADTVFAGFPNMERHQDWHFFDNPFSTDGTTTHPGCKPNALMQIQQFQQDLGNPSKSLALKAFELPWLLHLVGDVHQPLHATTRFTADFLPGDRGGNSVNIDHGSNLHSFWDDVVGRSQTEEFIARLATGITDTIKPAATLQPQDWINESVDLAKKHVYKFEGAGTTNDLAVLTDAYKVKARQIARERIAQAGYRLAAMLNQLFDK